MYFKDSNPCNLVQKLLVFDNPTKLNACVRKEMISKASADSQKTAGQASPKVLQFDHSANCVWGVNYIHYTG